MTATEYPLLCIRGDDCRPEEHGGPRRTDHAYLCWLCIKRTRENLERIASSWDDLEDALSSSERVDSEKGNQKHGMVATGTNLNEKASGAMRQASEVVWFVAQMIRDDFDRIGRTFNPPQGGVAEVAGWIATWHVDHLASKSGEDNAVESADDIAEAWRQVRAAAYPSGVHWTEVGLPCERHGTSEAGERVPCEGIMRALVGKGTLPDLVCTVDATHIIEPAEWERAGWRRAHRNLNPDGVANLARRLGA